MVARPFLLAFVIVSGSIVANSAFARTLTISCQRVDDAGNPKKGYALEIYYIDVDNQTVSHTADYLSPSMYPTPPSYSAPAQITDDQISWRARGFQSGSKYKLDRYSGTMVEEGVNGQYVPMKYKCNRKIE